MVSRHIILIALWILFCVLHSLLASNVLKKRMQLLMQSNFKFYRIAYSFFALVTLLIIVVYNFTLQSLPLWNVILIEKIFAITAILLFGFIMILFIKKFFFDLSGADIFRKQIASRQLIKTDLYKYVRHPLYSATLGFIWSIFFYQPLISNLISCLCITIYTIIGIYIEEKKLVTEFGESYIQYSSETPMLIPSFLPSNKPVN